MKLDMQGRVCYVYNIEGSVAERLEHGSRNTEVVGSSPGPGGLRLFVSLGKKLYSNCSVVRIVTLSRWSPVRMLLLGALHSVYTW